MKDCTTSGVLVDTSVLCRPANTADSFYTVATRSVLQLHRAGEVLHVTPQNLIEFRSVATRPVAANGLGLSREDAEIKTDAFEAAFALLADTPEVYPAWKNLVGALGVVGKQVHDARLVALCHTYGLTHLLTFNTQHVSRMSAYGPGLTVVNPANF